MIVDILVLVVLLISALIAFLRGFIREVLTITGVVGGLAAAYFGGPLLVPVMRGWLGVEEGVEPERLFGILPYDIVADALSYGSIFIIVVILLSILSHFLAESAKTIGLGAVDRTLGFIFGILRGVVLLGLLYLPVHLFIDDEATAGWFEDSKTHFYLEKTSAALADFIPSSAVKDMEEGVEDLKEASQTRKKLEEINLLQREDGANGRGGDASPDRGGEQGDTGQEGSEGYSDEFRNKMDRLFEDEAGHLNE
ncbi:MAG: CvpA family protein [Alphaproteobacteria bacterium]